MKKAIKTTRGLIKGTPTAVLVSIGVHLVLFFTAGTLVVFTVVTKMEKKFTPPPPVEHKKIPPKKVRVKVRKQPRPKSSQRISSTSVQSATDFQLPEIADMSGGFGSRLGGIEIMPDISKISLFGSKDSIAGGNDFEGTFYSMSIDNRGRPTGIEDREEEYARVRRRFYESGWNPRALSMYYRSPQKLYSTFFFIPMTASSFVPRSFGIEMETPAWMAHYKGQFAAKESGEYRFWGRGDNVCDVRVNGKMVLQGGHPGDVKRSSDWTSTAPEDREYYRGHGPMGVGDWFTLEAGVPADFEIVFGDASGAWTQCTLTIQKKGEFYPLNPGGAPILPVFKTAPIPQHLIDEISYSLLQQNGDAADLKSPVMFNVY